MITIVTLFSGRWFTLDAFLTGLKNIKYDKKEIKLVWVTNSTDLYMELLKKIKEDILHEYASIDIYQSKVGVSENAFCENGPRTYEHAITIAKLYNMAWDKVETDKVLFLEDDISAPSNAIEGLLPILDTETPYCIGVQFCRHQNIPFCWDIKEVPEGYSYSKQDSLEAVRPRYLYGIQEVGCGHFGLTMMDKKIIDAVVPRPIFKPQCLKEGAKHFTGCDIVLCLELREVGLKRKINWDVRGLHYDSNGVPH